MHGGAGRGTGDAAEGLGGMCSARFLCPQWGVGLQWQCSIPTHARPHLLGHRGNPYLELVRPHCSPTPHCGCSSLGGHVPPHAVALALSPPGSTACAPLPCCLCPTPPYATSIDLPAGSFGSSPPLPGCHMHIHVHMHMASPASDHLPCSL